MIKNRIASILKKIANKLDNPQSTAYENTISFLKLAQTLDYDPKCILDIGANEGQWTSRSLKIFPECSYYLFEPGSKAFSRLKENLGEQNNVKIFNQGMGSQESTMTFYSNPTRSDSSSFIKSIAEQSAKTKVGEGVIVNVTTIDNFCTRHSLKPDIIKIDAEGFDLEVINGGKKSICQSSIVLAEASVLNRCMPLGLDTLITEMRDLGLDLVDFTDLNRTLQKRGLWLVEAAFARSDSKFFRDFNSYYD